LFDISICTLYRDIGMPLALDAIIQGERFPCRC